MVLVIAWLSFAFASEADPQERGRHMHNWVMPIEDALVADEDLRARFTERGVREIYVEYAVTDNHERQVALEPIFKLDGDILAVEFDMYDEGKRGEEFGNWVGRRLREVLTEWLDQAPPIQRAEEG